MPFLFGGAYRRLGPRYFALYLVFDAVNVAARVEAITRNTGDAVLLTEATRCLLAEPDSGVEARGEAELRGIAEPVRLYAPTADLDERSMPPQKTLITDA